MNQKKSWVIIAVVAVLLIGGGVLFWAKGNNGTVTNTPQPSPEPEPVNVIPVSERPYVELKPLAARNELMMVIHDVKKPADEVEVVLEYDRNKGVLDAVLRQFDLTKIPMEGQIFMGSKSAGGHITYHDDVIGGTIQMKFQGQSPYTLKTPWRYSDTQNEYGQLSTTDARLQLSVTPALKVNKVIIMVSPGLPQNLDQELLAGPYLIRTVNHLPQTSTVDLKIRLTDEVDSAKLLGWDGDKWQEIASTKEGKTVSATTKFYDVFVVTR